MGARIWGVSLVVLALLAGVYIGMRQAGVQWPGSGRPSRSTLRPDLGSEARLGSPLAPVPAPPAAGGPGSGGGGSGSAGSSPPAVPGGGDAVPVDGEVVYLGDRGRAILTGKSGALLVTGNDGKELLRQSAQGLEGWWSWQAGGTTLLWLRYYDTGASRLNRIFRYDATQDRFLPVNWGNEGPDHRGTLTFVADGNYLQEQVSVDAHHTRSAVWRYVGTSQLQLAAGAYRLSDENWYPTSADGLLVAFLESVGMRLEGEARRYFADPNQADSYYRILSSQILAYGHAHVLLGDALDPQKQEFPFFLDMDGTNPGDNYYYLSLQGSVGLKQTPDGKRLQLDSFRYSVVPEPIDQARAVALVKALPDVRTMTTQTFRAAHGWAHWTLVFADSGPVYEVDSRSGDIYRLSQDGRKVPVIPRSSQ